MKFSKDLTFTFLFIENNKRSTNYKVETCLHISKSTFNQIYIFLRYQKHIVLS